MYKVVLSRQAEKDLTKLKNTNKIYVKKVKQLIDVVKCNPFAYPPQYEKLIGELHGCYSRRINDKHRFVYNVVPNENKYCTENNILYKGVVHILRLWTHYD